MQHEIHLSEQFSSGINKIDYQHQYLFDRIDNLRSLLDRKAGISRDDLEDILDDMFEFFQKHFKFEEELLHRHPFLKSHKVKHQLFIDSTKEFEKKLFTKEPTALGTEMYSFLSEWLQEHIVQEDLKYFAYLRENKFVVPGMTP